MQWEAAKRESSCQASTIKIKLPFNYFLADRLNVVYDKTSWTFRAIHEVINVNHHVTGDFRVISFCTVFLNRLNADFLIFKECYSKFLLLCI